jgi:hypothetical protein
MASSFGRPLLGFVLAARPIKQSRPQEGLELKDFAADPWLWRFNGASQPKGCWSPSASAMSRSLRPLAGKFS